MNWYEFVFTYLEQHWPHWFDNYVNDPLLQVDDRKTFRLALDRIHTTECTPTSCPEVAWTANPIAFLNECWVGDCIEAKADSRLDGLAGDRRGKIVPIDLPLDYLHLVYGHLVESRVFNGNFLREYLRLHGQAGDIASVAFTALLGLRSAPGQAAMLTDMRLSSRRVMRSWYNTDKLDMPFCVDPFPSVDEFLAELCYDPAMDPQTILAFGYVIPGELTQPRQGGGSPRILPRVANAFDPGLCDFWQHSGNPPSGFGILRECVHETVTGDNIFIRIAPLEEHLNGIAP